MSRSFLNSGTLIVIASMLSIVFIANLIFFTRSVGIGLPSAKDPRHCEEKRPNLMVVESSSKFIL
jgi:hypothetical protein